MQIVDMHLTNKKTPREPWTKRNSSNQVDEIKLMPLIKLVHEKHGLSQDFLM